MQSSVVAMSTSMGALGSQASGVLGPMVGLVGGMGLLGIAVTGVGLGLSFGINKLKSWRAEQKKSSDAAEGFRNRLMLSGFSADNARSSVDELRSSLGRLAFQALPGLDFEMQGFLANMDAATRSRFAEFVQLLTDKGVDASKAMNAIGEALQGNFGPISALLSRPITSFGEFTAEMARLSDQAIEVKSEVLGAIRSMANGSESFGKTSEEIWSALVHDVEATGEAFGQHKELVLRILEGLSQEQKDALADYLIQNKERRQSDNDYKGALQENTDILIGLLSGAIKPNEDWAASVQSATQDAIEAWRFVNPEVRDELQELRDQYLNGEITLRQFQMGIDRILKDAVGNYGQFADDAIAQLDRVAVATRALQGNAAAASRARGLAFRGGRTLAEADPFGATVNQRALAFRGGRTLAEADILGTTINDDDLGFGVGQPTSSRRVSAPLVVNIGGQRVADLVVEAMGEELTIREPSIGIG
jgi:hypothetical protein